MTPTRCPTCKSFIEPHWGWVQPCIACGVPVCGEPVRGSDGKAVPCYVKHTAAVHPEKYEFRGGAQG